MMADGKKPGVQPESGALRHRHRRHLAAGRRDSVDRQARQIHKQDHVVAAPRAAARDGGRREGVRRAAGKADRLQPALPKEAQLAAVRRPERHRRAIGVGQQAGHQ